jgi:probable rRNA maturation factor
MCELDNQTNKNIDIDFLDKILSSLTHSEVELIIVNNSTIKQINHEYRQINKPTDVLSFPLDNMANIPDFPLGSIIISIDFVEQKAKELKHSEDEEMALLFIHGVLHLLGFDHEVDNGEHRQKEEELIKQFNLPNSLIVRTDKE